MDVTGFSVQSQLAMIGMRAERQQQQVMAEVVINAAESAKQTGAAALASPSQPASGGRLVDMKV